MCADDDFGILHVFVQQIPEALCHHKDQCHRKAELPFRREGLIHPLTAEGEEVNAVLLPRILSLLDIRDQNLNQKGLEQRQTDRKHVEEGPVREFESKGLKNGDPQRSILTLRLPGLLELTQVILHLVLFS